MTLSIDISTADFLIISGMANIALLVAVWMLWRLLKKAIYMDSATSARTLEILKDKESAVTYIREVDETLRRFTGGVTKRISEDDEIQEAIQNHAPELFDKVPGLKHWLSAHKEFHTELARHLK